MTLRFPRYSKDGKKLEKADVDYSCSTFFRRDLCEYFKPFSKSLSPEKNWDLSVLLYDAHPPASLGAKHTWHQWVASVYGLTDVFLSKEAAINLTEDYIARMYPLLEPPHSSI